MSEPKIETSCAECAWYGAVGDCDYALRTGGIQVLVNGTPAFTANVEHINHGNCQHFQAKEGCDTKT